MIKIISYAVSIFIIVIIANFYEGYKCKSYERITGKNTYYNDFDACYVWVKGNEYVTYLHWDEYIAAQTAINLKGE